MISVFGSDVGAAELDALASCLDRQWLGMGAETRRFESRFRERLGLPNFLMVDSGSNALYLAVALLDLPAGSEVIVPTFTWVSCAQAVLLAGCRPVFADVDPATQNVTADTVRARLTRDTSAVMVVHYAGKPVDLDPILALGLPVIEDAAHAVDSRLGDRACGGIGDVGIYSFDAVKNLTAGAGGGLTVRDPARFERARRLRYCGIGQSSFDAVSSGAGSGRWWEYDIAEAFIRMTPSDLNAAIANRQLDRLDALQARRAEIWRRYQAAFDGVDAVVTPRDPGPGERHSWFTYFVQLPERDRIARELLAADIYTTLRFHPLHLNPLYGPAPALPHAERLNETGLNLPLHPRLSDAEVTWVIDAVRKALP